MNSGIEVNPYRIMIVDDSSIVRKMLKSFIADDEIIVVAEAENGQIAIDNVVEADPDVILLDIEMPEMDGITALPELLSICPNSRVIMVSTLTKANAAIGIQALSKGASDYIEKPSSDTDKEVFRGNLIRKVKAIGKSSRQSVRGDRRSDFKAPNEDKPKNSQTAIDSPPPIEAEKVEATTSNIEKTAAVQIEVDEQKAFRKTTDLSKVVPEVLAIGCSTGGPQALNELFRGLGNKIDNIPIFITQHMPPSFTTFLAKNISQVSGAECLEGEDGMIVEVGKIYLAPGDYHMTIARDEDKKIIRLNQGPPENFCRPSVDPMLKSLVEVYGSKICALIMTGMGSDGIGGVRVVSEKGGMVVIQDEETSIVWGMPGAVAEQGLQDLTLPISEIAPKILSICKGA